MELDRKVLCRDKNKAIYVPESQIGTSMLEPDLMTWYVMLEIVANKFGALANRLRRVESG